MFKWNVVKWGVFVLVLVLSGGVGVQVKELVDLDMVSCIWQEVFYCLQVMVIFSYFIEQIGLCLINFLVMFEVNVWICSRFMDWGLQNVYDEVFDVFGCGWEFSNVNVEMFSLWVILLYVLLKVWMFGMCGLVEGEVIKVDIKKFVDFDQYKGKFVGKILLFNDVCDYVCVSSVDLYCYDDVGLVELQVFVVFKDVVDVKVDCVRKVKEYLEKQVLICVINVFFVEQGVLVIISISGWDNGIICVGGGGLCKVGELVGVLELVMMVEYYNQLVCVLDYKQLVKLCVDVQVCFIDDIDQFGYNMLVEICGSSKVDEIVMFGVYLDLWYIGIGVVDNVVGVVVMMEVMCIFKVVGVKFKCIIWVVLWSGEEQGLVGLQDYVLCYLVCYFELIDLQQLMLLVLMCELIGVLQCQCDYDWFLVYFNMDNGLGCFCGIYVQENLVVVLIFEVWFVLFYDVGVIIVVMCNIGSIDYIVFDCVGLFGFQFIQDCLDYFINVYYSNLDIWDYVELEDFKQVVVIVVFFVYYVVMCEEKLLCKLLFVF